MSEVTYEIVEHDGGWAYKSQGVFSEPYPTHAAALKAAQTAAAEQKVPGREAVIEFEDEQGQVAHRNRSRRRPPRDVGQGHQALRAAGQPA